MSNISNSDKPNVLILWSGTPDGGGSWPRMLIDNIKKWVLNATIAWLVTHYPNWWVAELWKENEKLFDTYVIEWFPSRKKWDKFTPEQILIIKEIYKNAIDRFWWIDSINHILLSWWMKLVLWLPTEKTENIHPSRIDRWFWGEGKYGDLAHQHAFAAYQRGEISETALTMHFADGEFDHWPVIAQ
jgi:folate-dependent phosphoribosylglycinamide formyltransferase PurN